MTRIHLRNQAAGAEFIGLAAPPQWDAVFGGTGPLELEIGAGMGVFAIAYCAKFPARRLVAIEKRAKYAREGAHRGAALPNLRFIEGDALLEVPRLFALGTLDVIRIHFPDPWWKRSQRRRSVIQPGSAQLFFKLLKTGGMIELRSDVGERASEMLTCLEAAGFTNPLGKGNFHPMMNDEVPSARERRFLTTSAPVFRARLEKPSPKPKDVDAPTP